MSTSTEAFYERFPFPGECSSQEASTLHDLANGIQMVIPAASLQQARVADVGCGTGQRLVNLAQRYPNARFVGVDPSLSSIEQGRAAASKAGLSNIEWRTQRLEVFAASGEIFDLVIASGLIHHLEDPRAGVRDLARLLSPHGVLYAWLYHSIGEFDRLRRRELARVFCPDFADAERVAQISTALSLQLPSDHYGPNSVYANDDSQPPRAVVDAFFHPTVTAFRFAELPSLLAGCALDWYFINSINTPGASYLLNVGNAKGIDCLLAPKMSTYLPGEVLRAAYTAKSIVERLRIIELLLKPTGFTLLAARQPALEQFSERVRRGACSLEHTA